MTDSDAPNPRWPDGIHPSPNIQTDPDVYETENLAADPDGLVERAMHRIAPWDGRTIVDLGAGTGFHLPRFHEAAWQVIAIEPHGPSRLRAMRRVADLGLERASVLMGSAEAIPLRDASVDIVHARFAYFFGPGCEPGLLELERVIRPGGTAFIIDNDLRGGDFTGWLRRQPEWTVVDPDTPDTIEAFWSAHGFGVQRIATEWRFQRRQDLEAVVRLEFPADIADGIIHDHAGLSVSYHYLLLHRTF